MNHIRIAVCSIVLLILAGCKGGKELISERPVSQEVRNNFESLMASYPDWNTFSAKGSADLSFGASGSLSAFYSTAYGPGRSVANLGENHFGHRSRSVIYDTRQFVSGE